MSKHHIPRQNWEQIIGRFTELEKELLGRIETKTDEIRGLRDGVSTSTVPQDTQSSDEAAMLIPKRLSIPTPSWRRPSSPR